jgi:hypothetical protein
MMLMLVKMVKWIGRQMIMPLVNNTPYGDGLRVKLLVIKMKSYSDLLSIHLKKKELPLLSNSYLMKLEIMY